MTNLSRKTQCKDCNVDERKEVFYHISLNYAPTLLLQKLLRERGYDTSLWLYGPDDLITEAGTMNIFVFWTNEQGEKELRTPPLSGLILPGVTRQSALEIARSWNEFKVVEKDITMSMLLNALKENRLHHMFGTGTACVVSPVMELYYKNNRYSIPFTEDPSSLPERILKEYTDIQYLDSFMKSHLIKAVWPVNLNPV
ncbi:hypothetical protein CRM22_010651 [Opisthorchis felineus]|uniref:Branched-chain-amino-acid aminotransferase n=1 Tax=Opisthorchis felineus TaxID=147828 RepID=A0A4S2KR74_OPIFE|nr:hypothetical protein CRM22_010651 [Opisthorchis felineus]